MGATVSVTIELFGTARMACGRRLVEAEITKQATMADLTIVLAKICPKLVGVALQEDLSGLMSSYTLNLNATEFVQDDELSLQDGDMLLLFSSQAGG